MKNILVTMRMDAVSEYSETRDAIDYRWSLLLPANGMLPCYLPNIVTLLQHYDFSTVDGIILTGGNSLAKYGGDAMARDLLEHKLLTIALQKRIPVLGVCRGMQVIQDYFNIKLHEVDNHVNKYHKLCVAVDSLYAESLNKLSKVNSYHKYGAYICDHDDLRISAKSEDNVIMAIEHRNLPVFGQMWHSEREEPFVAEELVLIRKIFNV